ncbi:unnamed protein product [Trichobilharzia regenti]|nr:unnamed protein product [Trichobilharzia regenti]
MLIISGNNGVGYILHITSRLLDPSNPVEWAIPAGKLAYAILLRFNAQQLRENTDLLLRGVLARLCTLISELCFLFSFFFGFF